MQLEPYAANRLADEMAAMLDGGMVEIFDKNGKRLASAKFKGFQSVQDGVLTGYPFEPAIAENDGVPFRFEAYGQNLRRVLTGTAGHRSDKPKPDMAFKTKQLVKDGDVMIETFIFSVA